METITVSEVNLMTFPGNHQFKPGEKVYLSPVPAWGPTEHAATWEEWNSLIPAGDAEARNADGVVLHLYLRWIGEFMAFFHKSDTGESECRQTQSAQFWPEWRDDLFLELRVYEVAVDEEDEDDGEDQRVEPFRPTGPGAELKMEILRKGDRPKGAFIVEGDRFFDTVDEINGYGDWIAIRGLWVWYIRHVPGDFSKNNVVMGGSGAVGYRVPRTEKLEARIRALAEQHPALDFEREAELISA